MIVGEATATVSASANDVFDFVLDLERYRQADRKIGRVGAIDDRGDRGSVSSSGSPPAFATSDRAFGSPVAGLARWFLDFEGTFDCAEGDHGTVVTHRVVFSFKRPGR